MKIGLICPYDISRRGGVYEQVAAIRTELERRGHIAKIITPEPQGIPDCSTDNTIFIGTAVDLKSPFHTTVQVSASLNESIDRMLAAEKFDVLHFHEPWVPMLGRQILGRSQNTLNVATFHAALPDTPMSRTIMKTVTLYTKSTLKYVHEYTAVSEAAAQYICSLTDNPVTIIPNGIDLDRFKSPSRRDDNKEHKTIFYVGRLENRKGVKYLLRAFKLLSEQKPDISLIIAGTGPDSDKLEALAQNLALDNVTFPGYITDDQKIQYLRTADLFCSPALYGESFGIVLLEAMATGIVTAAGNNPGYSAILHGLGSVSIVDPKDSEEFARRLDLLLHENELRKLWRSWAKEEVGQYSFTHVVSQYEELYKEGLIKRGRKRRSLRSTLTKVKQP